MADADVYVHGAGGTQVRAGRGTLLGGAGQAATATTVVLGTDGAANWTALDAALRDYDTVVFDGGGQVRPVSGRLTVDRTYKGTKLKAKALGDGLRVNVNDTTLLRVRGSLNPIHPTTAAIAAGATSFDLSSTDVANYAVGDWIHIQHSNATGDPGSGLNIGNAHGNEHGWMRQITAISGTTVTFASITHPVTAVAYGIPFDMDLVAGTRGPHVQKIDFKKFTVDGGIYEMANPSAATIARPIIELLAVDTPTMVNRPEVRAGGQEGVFLQLCRNLSLDVYVHDLLDDPNLTGYWREAAPTTLLAADAHQHFGYGICLVGSNLGGTVTGRGEYCRHAVTTNQGSGNQKIHGNQNTKSGHPEAIVFDGFDVANCWSTNISDHENGYAIVFKNFTSRNPGRAQDSAMDGGVRNPNHFAGRNHETYIINATFKSDVGVKDAKSFGFSLANNIFIDSIPEPTHHLDNVLILGQDTIPRIADTYGPVVVEAGGLTGRNASVGLLIQNDGWKMAGGGGVRLGTIGGNDVQFQSGADVSDILAESEDGALVVGGTGHDGVNNKVTAGTVAAATGDTTV
jgi:hypothetical protein